MWHCMFSADPLGRVVRAIVVILTLEPQHVPSADAIVRLQLLRSHCESLDSSKIVNAVLWLLIIDAGYRFVAVDATPLPSIRQYLAVQALSVNIIKRKHINISIKRVMCSIKWYFLVCTKASIKVSIRDSIFEIHCIKMKVNWVSKVLDYVQNDVFINILYSGNKYVDQQKKIEKRTTNLQCRKKCRNRCKKKDKKLTM